MLSTSGEARHDQPAGPPEGGGRSFEWRYQVRVSDLNPGAHLDNLHILRVADEGRFHLLGLREPDGRSVVRGCLDLAPPSVGVLVAAHRAQYLRELWFADEPLAVRLWVCRLGGSSLDLAAEIRQRPADPPATLVVTTLVLVDRQAGAPWPMSERVRGALTAYLGAPPALRSGG